MDGLTITPPLTTSPFYKNIEYSFQEINDLKELLLTEEEKRKFDKMKPTTPKQAFLTLALLIDLSLVSKKQ